MDQQLPTFPTADHDLLIEVGANVKNMAATLQSYTASSSRTTLDHENRIRSLESDNQILKGSQRSFRTMLTVVSVLATISAAVAAFVALR